jgi:hypothetical protein
MAVARDPLARLRKIIGAWPETEERVSHGSPTFWGGRKTFASFHRNHHGDGRVALWCKSSLELQGDLVEASPEIFFVPPYVGPSGWLGIRLDRDVDWGLVAGLLEQGYRSVAPARALRRLDAPGPSARRDARTLDQSAAATPARKGRSR